MKSILILTMLFSISFAKAGGFVNNGADRKGLATGVAWFLGEKPVRWCGSQKIESPFLQAAQMWEKYIENKKIYSDLKSPKKFSLKFERMQTCDGTEDLKFVLDLDQSNLLSESEVLHYDSQKSWGKGIIHLHPLLLENETLLFNQLLHQLGHLLGCDHAPGTIMADDLSELNKDYRKTIDSSRELYLCQTCTNRFVNVNGVVYEETAASAKFHFPVPVEIQITETLGQRRIGDSFIFAQTINNLRYQLESIGMVQFGIAKFSNQTRSVIIQRNIEQSLLVQFVTNGEAQNIFENNK